MTSIENHQKKIQEHLEELQDAVRIGIEKRPATIGFHTSACSIDFLEILLHKKQLIDIGKTVKHDWFKRPKEGQKIDPLIERKLPANFPEKEKIYNLIYTLEDHRNVLIYGKPGKHEIELVLSKFQELKEILIKKLEEEGEIIE